MARVTKITEKQLEVAMATAFGWDRITPNNWGGYTGRLPEDGHIYGTVPSIREWCWECTIELATEQCFLWKITEEEWAVLNASDDKVASEPTPERAICIAWLRLFRRGMKWMPKKKAAKKGKKSSG